jgi:hypothetical protein
MDSTHNRRPGDTQELGDLPWRQPLVLVIGATVPALVPAGWPGSPGRSLGSAALGEGLDLLTAQGGAALARGGQGRPFG